MADSHDRLNQRTVMRFVRSPEVLEITGLSRATIWRLRRAGKFPQPHRISPGAVGWDSMAIQGWIQATLAAPALPHSEASCSRPISNSEHPASCREIRTDGV